MSDEINGGIEATVSVWVVFGDLMSVLLGAFMLILVDMTGMQPELSSKLEDGVRQHEAKAQRCKTLEQALVGPLAAGRVTLTNGCIDINGNVLFAVNSGQLQPKDRALMKSPTGPLATYLTSCEEILMVSGFSDDQRTHAGSRLSADNQELSAKCVLTVTRALVDKDIPASSVFAAAFGLQQSVSSNADDVGRIKNWHVEVVPVPRQAASNGGHREPR